MNKSSNAYYLMAVDEAIRSLASDKTNGLSQEEAKKRLKIYGENTISVKEKWHLLKLLRTPWSQPLLIASLRLNIE